MPHINLRGLNALLISHEHLDHSKSFNQFQRIGINTITWENVEDGKIINLEHWKILPMRLIHNVECFGFLIYNKLENKRIAYITDTTYIPKLAKVDCLIIDTNYSHQKINEKLNNGENINKGYKNHLSVEDIAEYLKLLDYQIPYLVAYHISNSGLNDVEIIQNLLSSLVGELIISKPNTKFEL